MKRVFGILAVLVLGAGCGGDGGKPPETSSAAPLTQSSAEPSPTTPATQPGTDGSPALAIVNGVTITRAQLDEPLIKAHGLNMLLELVQLEVAKQEAAEAHLTVSPADIDDEMKLSLHTIVPEATPDDFPSVIQQILTAQHLTRVDFDLWLETNAYLRKVAEPAAIKWATDERVREAFGVTYGEQIQVRHIQFSHLSQAAEIKQRLAGGEAFEQVAEELSENERTKKLGGELIPFAQNSPSLPTAFKDAAFALKKEGDVSDIVQADGAYHIIKLEKRIPPKVVKFEDVKDVVRKDLIARATQAQMTDLRNAAALRARKTLILVDPEMKKQFDAQVAAAEAEQKEQEKADIERDLTQKAHESALQKALENAKATTAPTGQPPATESVSPALPDTSAPVSPDQPK